MATTTLSTAQAFSPGSDLWIIANDSPPEILKKIDWYLNFQLTRARRHKATSLAPQMKSILTENPIPNIEFNRPENSSLLILANGQLPCQFVLVHGDENGSSGKKWSQSIYDAWVKLKKPTVRVFLPKAVTSSQFLQGWGSGDDRNDLTFVTA